MTIKSEAFAALAVSDELSSVGLEASMRVSDAAIHEAGHAIVAVHVRGIKLISVSLHSNPKVVEGRMAQGEMRSAVPKTARRFALGGFNFGEKNIIINAAGRAVQDLFVPQTRHINAKNAAVDDARTVE